MEHIISRTNAATVSKAEQGTRKMKSDDEEQIKNLYVEGGVVIE